MAEPLFLTLDEALLIHADQIRRHGGSHGVRDLGLLSSALDELTEMVIGVAAGRVGKVEAAVFIRARLRPL